MLKLVYTTRVKYLSDEFCFPVEQEWEAVDEDKLLEGIFKALKINSRYENFEEIKKKLEECIPKCSLIRVYREYTAGSSYKYPIQKQYLKKIKKGAMVKVFLEQCKSGKPELIVIKWKK